MNGQPIRRVRERLVYSDPANRWLRVYFDDVETNDGHSFRYNRVVEGQEKAGPPVVVIPCTTEGSVAFVKVFRYPVERWFLELPRGFGEVGFDALEAAKKELFEETGLKAASYQQIGAIYPNTGLLATKVAVVQAIDLESSNAIPCKGEGIVNVVFLNRLQIEDGLRSGEISDGISLAALLLHSLARKGESAKV